jgi:hypothetical protein
MQKITHTQILILDAVFKRLGSATEPWFAYTVAKNKTAMAPVLEALQAARQRSPEFEKFEAARKQLLEKHANKDASGAPIAKRTTLPDGSVQETYDIADQAALSAELQELITSEEYADIIRKEEARLVKLQELLTSTVEVDLVPIRMSEAPEGILTGNDMSVLMEAGLLDWDLKRDPA